MIPDYQVRLDAFEGPLDLLLFLIRKSEVDIHDIPVGVITHQYLAYLDGAGGLAALDVETAGEFLVMAATLVEIKSRMIMPAAKREGGEGAAAAEAPAVEDPRQTLVRQLLEYKRFRDAAMALEARQAEWDRRFPVAPALAPTLPAPVADENDAVEVDDLTLVDLVAAFTRIIETVDFARVGEHRVLDDETPIQIHAEDLVDRLRKEGGPEKSLYFAEVFRGKTRAEAIGLFLAMLELVRYGKLRATQEARGPIRLTLREDEAALAPEAAVV